MKSGLTTCLPSEACGLNPPGQVYVYVADAFAAGSQAGIGGVIYFPPGVCRWFSLPLHSSDFDQLHIPVHDDLQKDIAALETLAQIALVCIAVKSFPGARIPIRVPTL